ncbi:MAG: glycosyltransferase family 2 protein, partial [Ilumatobacter sp.]
PSRSPRVSWLEPLLAHFDDPRVGLVAPRVLGGRHTSLDLGAEPARIRVGTRVSYVPAAAIVVRAAAFDDVGGFDETLRFGEDVDFVWRLDAAGWTCRYEPGSTVWHEPRPDRIGRLRQQVGYGSSAAPLALRHPTALAPLRSDGLLTSTWVLGALGHPVLGAACAIAGAAGVRRKLPGVPTPVALRLAGKAQIATGRQVATAIRRVWWPFVVPLAVMSRRARLVALASVLADPPALPTDLAYGWGVWRGMRGRRTLRPAVPKIGTRTGRSGADGFSGSGPDRRS